MGGLPAICAMRLAWLEPSAALPRDLLSGRVILPSLFCDGQSGLGVCSALFAIPLGAKILIVPVAAPGLGAPRADLVLHLLCGSVASTWQSPA